MSFVFINCSCLLGHFSQYNQDRKARCPLDTFLWKSLMLIFCIFQKKKGHDCYNYLWSYLQISWLHHLRVEYFLKYWLDSQEPVFEPITWTFGFLPSGFILVCTWWVQMKAGAWFIDGWLIYFLFLSLLFSSLNMDHNDQMLW